jgi:hypothetical protein
MNTTKNITGRKRAEQSFDANLRMDHVVDIASLIGSETLEGSRRRLDGPAEELLDWLLSDDYKVHPSLEPLRELARQALPTDDDDLELLHEVLYVKGVFGLAVCFSTPVMERTGKSSWSFSWGYTTSTWIYAETYDEAWSLGVAWAEKCRAEAKPAPNKRQRRQGGTKPTDL